MKRNEEIQDKKNWKTKQNKRKGKKKGYRWTLPRFHSWNADVFTCGRAAIKTRKAVSSRSDLELLEPVPHGRGGGGGGGGGPGGWRTTSTANRRCFRPDGNSCDFGSGRRLLRLLSFGRFFSFALHLFSSSALLRWPRCSNRARLKGDFKGYCCCCFFFTGLLIGTEKDSLMNNPLFLSFFYSFFNVPTVYDSQVTLREPMIDFQFLCLPSARGFFGNFRWNEFRRRI